MSPKPLAPFLNRLAWMVAIWALSILTLGIVTLGIRFWLKG